jgi:hypothetical protein
MIVLAYNTYNGQHTYTSGEKWLNSICGFYKKLPMKVWDIGSGGTQVLVTVLDIQGFYLTDKIKWAFQKRRSHV